MKRVVVQSVLYLTPVADLEDVLHSFERVGQRMHVEGDMLLCLAWGDCSPTETVSASVVSEWQKRFAKSFDLVYTFFGENLGHGGAQNRLASEVPGDYRVFINPDVVVLSDSISALVKVLIEDPRVGIVDGKQIPFEHPKNFDAQTGDTAWCSGAFAAVRSAEFLKLGGFDHDNFFMHGDDVDLSWRYRLAGFTASHQPAAACFHDKRANENGAPQASHSEPLHSAVSALLLAHKYSRPDLVEILMTYMTSENATPEHQSAAGEYKRRTAEGRLPIAIDSAHRVAQFTNGTYGGHRW